MKPSFYALIADIVLFVAVLHWFAHISPKIEVCRTYYKELGLWACYSADHLGFPPRNSK